MTMGKQYLCGRDKALVLLRVELKQLLELGIRFLGASSGGDVGEGSRGEKPGLGSREPVLAATYLTPRRSRRNRTPSGLEDTPGIDRPGLASRQASRRLMQWRGGRGGDDRGGAGEEGDGEVGTGGLLRRDGDTATTGVVGAETRGDEGRHRGTPIGAPGGVARALTECAGRRRSSRGGGDTVPRSGALSSEEVARSEMDRGPGTRGGAARPHRGPGGEAPAPPLVPGAQRNRARPRSDEGGGRPFVGLRSGKLGRPLFRRPPPKSSTQRDESRFGVRGGSAAGGERGRECSPRPLTRQILVLHTVKVSSAHGGGVPARNGGSTTSNLLKLELGW